MLRGAFGLLLVLVIYGVLIWKLVRMLRKTKNKDPE